MVLIKKGKNTREVYGESGARSVAVVGSVQRGAIHPEFHRFFVLYDAYVSSLPVSFSPPCPWWASLNELHLLLFLEAGKRSASLKRRSRSQVDLGVQEVDIMLFISD
ncbi:hypothetical protein NL676_032894 [Syzygium grande]|nr:hypothetical protein NL676_032894 [Syzygium grande]